MLDMLNLDKTAVLVMDYQNLLVQGYVKEPDAYLKKLSALLDKTRDRKVPVIYVMVGFRPGYPEVSDNNKIFSGVRAGGRLQLTDPQSAIPDAIAPRDGDAIVVKHRISAFEGTDLAMLLRSYQCDTLVMFGIATSGVVLSTVRQGGDLDYKMIVLSDLCHDNDQDVHSFLLEKLLPRQADITTSDKFLAIL